MQVVDAGVDDADDDALALVGSAGTSCAVPYLVGVHPLGTGVGQERELFIGRYEGDAGRGADDVGLTGRQLCRKAVERPVVLVDGLERTADRRADRAKKRASL